MKTRNSLVVIMLFKVIEGHRSCYYFLLVNNDNLHPVSHCFQLIAHYWSNFRCRVGVLLINAAFLSNLWEYCHKSYIAEN